MKKDIWGKKQMADVLGITDRSLERILEKHKLKTKRQTKKNLVWTVYNEKLQKKLEGIVIVLKKKLADQLKARQSRKRRSARRKKS